MSTLYGPEIIVSCPGSGKTTTLVRRINRLVESGVEPGSILMVTFTRAAASDMEKRYRLLYGSGPGAVFQTIHALCRNILLMEGVIGKDSLLNEKKSLDIISGLLEGRAEISCSDDMAEAMLSEFGRYKESDIPLEEYEPDCCEKTLFTETAKCDEYQDTSRIQKEILYMLAGEKANLCVVGDDDQSIYRFRGADNSIMMQFEEDFRDRGVQKILMNTNYRSASKIVDMADACIRHNTVRFDKEFISERGREGLTGKAEYRMYKTKAAEMNHTVRWRYSLGRTGRQQFPSRRSLQKTSRFIQLKTWQQSMTAGCLRISGPILSCPWESIQGRTFCGSSTGRTVTYRQGSSVRSPLKLRR